MKERFYTIIKKLKSEKGQGMVEYGFILLTIALVVIVGLPNLANALKNIFNSFTVWIK